MNVNSKTFGIDVAHLQRQSFIQSQTTRIDSPEIRMKPSMPDGVHDAFHFKRCQHVGQRFSWSSFNQAPIGDGFLCGLFFLYRYTFPCDRRVQMVPFGKKSKTLRVVSDWH